MRKNGMLGLAIVVVAWMTSVIAATPVNLRFQAVSKLPTLLVQPGFQAATVQSVLQPISSTIDFNQTKHVRLRQFYAGVPVWGSDIVVHTPKNQRALMNGWVYQGLSQDLGLIPDPAQAEKMLSAAIKLIHLKNPIIHPTIKLIIYTTQDNKAHWAYWIRFTVAKIKGVLPAKPNYIIDATTLEIYKKWDNIQTEIPLPVSLLSVRGSGFGGNEKRGKLTYDGLPNNLSALDIRRDSNNQTCYLTNDEVTVTNVKNNDAILSYQCDQLNLLHGESYWDGEIDAVNGGYSPGNDALYVGKIIQQMYKSWYGIPVLTDQNGKPLVLIVRVHEDLDNAYWDEETQMMTFGDGNTRFYPLVSLDVGAHEMSHGFTTQHSNLIYEGQSGGLNESFSDMAVQAAEYYSAGHSSWQIGSDIIKGDGSLRWMDKPTKDCFGGPPGYFCSIDHMKDYHDDIDVHFSSGIFNKVFYLIASEKGWHDTRKAFDIMVQANRNYWTANSNFTEAACGVLAATQDYHYDLTVVQKALTAVGIDYSQCGINA